MRALLCLIALLCAALAGSRGLAAQDPVGPPAPESLDAPAAATAPSSTTFQAPPSGPGVTLSFNAGNGRKTLGSAIEIFLLMTLLAMAPAIVMTMTCFTRIVVVLSFLKRAMSLQDLPPATITTGFALFMTVFVMKPVVADIHDQAYKPYIEERIGWEEAAELATRRMNAFLLAQTRDEDLTLILDLAREPRPSTAAATPFHVAVPAFVLSEIKTAFQMGFVLFLPFVVIDLVISSILVSMGMFSLPPVVVSTPLKLLLFIMVGGWDLVVSSLAQSFAT